MKKVGKELMSWAVIIVFAFIVVMVVHSQFISKRVVNHSSMEPTLKEGEQILVDKITYRLREPKVGEIVIFFDDKNRGTIIDDTVELWNSIFHKEKVEEIHRRLVKRVIGVEGDTIDIKDGYVYRNGVLLEERYTIEGNTHLSESSPLEYPITVGKNEYYVLGDNREVSLDSRDFGLINKKQLEGKINYRIYPFDVIGKVK